MRLDTTQLKNNVRLISVKVIKMMNEILLCLLLYKMGQQFNKQNSTGLSQNESPLLEKLSEKWQVDTLHFGNVKLYQLKQKPYSYYMKISHISQYDSLDLRTLYHYYNSIKDHKSLVKIEQISYKIKKQVCNTIEELSFFCQYYNHTLSDIINSKKKQKNGYFSQSNLIYILGCLSSIGQFIESSKRTISINFKNNQIYLTPQAYIKMYLIYTGQNFKRQNTIKFESSKSESLQVSQSKREKEKYQQQSRVKLKKQKCIHLMGNSTKKLSSSEDIFHIGICILCCVFLRNTEYYVDNFNYPNEQNILCDLQNNWPYEHYCSKLQKLLYKMIINHSQTYFHQIQEVIQNIKKDPNFKTTYFVNFQQYSSNTTAINSPNPQNSKGKSKSQLNELLGQKKLVVSKIQSIKSIQLNDHI